MRRLHEVLHFNRHWYSAAKLFVFFGIVLLAWMRIMLLLQLNSVDDDYFYRQIDQNDSNVEMIENYIPPENFEYSHPFENSCNLPLLRPEHSDIQDTIRHFRKFKCPPMLYDPLVSRDEKGEMIIGTPFGYTGARLDNLECYYRKLGGALWPTITEPTFKGPWKVLPLNKPFTLNTEQFAIKCWSKDTHALVFEDAFADILPRPDIRPPSVDDRLSVSILQIDSTSRNQFYRHSPKTLRFFVDNDFQILRGYTKVGDNSAINTLALLAGMGFEAEDRALDGLLNSERLLTPNETTGDIFQRVQMVLEKMRADGCATMWNDDIGKTTGGLFHYQAFTGFRRSPADYYFRPFYTYLYKNLNADKICSNGDFLIPRYLHLWEKFSTMYKDKCHFSFNHISYFTHADGNNLELYDDPLVAALERMKTAGVMENTVLIVMGDHGQRIHPIHHTFYGKVEERMPLAAIFMPKKFQKLYPKAYQQLIRNTNRFTSTFDLHETLKDIVDISFKKGTLPKPLNSVGISLFSEIQKKRNCRDAKVPINFCVCMEKLTDVRDIPLDYVNTAATQQMYEYFRESLDLECVASWNADFPKTFRYIQSLSSLVRYGPRYMRDWYAHLDGHAERGDLYREIVYLDYHSTVNIRLRNGTQNHRRVEFRFQFDRRSRDPPVMIVEPWSRDANSAETFRLADGFC